MLEVVKLENASKKMKKMKSLELGKLNVLLLAMMLLLMAPVSAETIPDLPQAFYGALTINGMPAPAGTVVEARGEGVLTGINGNPITTTQEVLYGGQAPLDPKLVVQGNIQGGSALSFFVNGVAADKTAAFHSGTTTRLDLNTGNHLPVISPIPGHAVGAGDEILIDVAASDPDGDTLTYSFTPKTIYYSTNNPAQIDTATGIFTWTPTIIGKYLFDIQVSDGIASASVPLTIIVNPVTVLGISSTSINEGRKARTWITVDNFFGVSGLQSYKLKIFFDNTKVTVDSVAGGMNSIFRNPQANIQNELGWVEIQDAVEPWTNPNGAIIDISLAEITFAPVSDSGTSELNLDVTSLLNSDNNNVPATAVSGTITVVPGSPSGHKAAVSFSPTEVQGAQEFSVEAYITNLPLYDEGKFDGIYKVVLTHSPGFAIDPDSLSVIPFRGSDPDDSWTSSYDPLLRQITWETGATALLWPGNKWAFRIGTMVSPDPEADTDYTWSVETWAESMSTPGKISFGTDAPHSGTIRVLAQDSYAPPPGVTLPLPQSFFGEVTINGVPAPVGTEIKAIGKGVPVGWRGNPMVVTNEGVYGAPGQAEPKLVVQGNVDGPTDNLAFLVNGIEADQTAVWQSGELTQLGLSVNFKVHVKPDSAIIILDDQVKFVQFTAEARRLNGDPVTPALPVAWSMKNNDNTVGDIEENGLFTAFELGSASIIATIEDVIGTADVTVAPLIVTTDDSGDIDELYENRDYLITLSATCEPLGCAWTKYCIGQSCDPAANGITYASPILISAEGVNYLSYTSADNAGNIGPVMTRTIEVDKSAPETADDYKFEDEVWQNNGQVISITPNCGPSGCEWTKYCMGENCNPANDGTLYSGPITIAAEGTHLLKYASKDNAGNMQPAVTKKIKIDHEGKTENNRQFKKGENNKILWEDVTLDIDTASDASASISVRKLASAQGTSDVGVPELGKYVEITAPLLAGNINSALIKLSYTDAEVAAAGIDESTLRLYFFDETLSQWTKYDGNDGTVPDGGVDTANNVVWARTNHFSTWGAFGSAAPAPSQNGGDGGGGGNTATAATGGGGKAIKGNIELKAAAPAAQPAKPTAKQIAAPKAPEEQPKIAVPVEETTPAPQPAAGTSPVTGMAIKNVQGKGNRLYGITITFTIVMAGIGLYFVHNRMKPRSYALPNGKSKGAA